MHPYNRNNQNSKHIVATKSAEEENNWTHKWKVPEELTILHTEEKGPPFWTKIAIAHQCLLRSNCLKPFRVRKKILIVWNIPGWSSGASQVKNLFDQNSHPQELQASALEFTLCCSGSFLPSGLVLLLVETYLILRGCMKTRLYQARTVLKLQPKEQENDGLL